MSQVSEFEEEEEEEEKSPSGNSIFTLYHLKTYSTILLNMGGEIRLFLTILNF